MSLFLLNCIFDCFTFSSIISSIPLVTMISQRTNDSGIHSDVKYWIAFHLILLSKYGRRRRSRTSLSGLSDQDNQTHILYAHIKIIISHSDPSVQFQAGTFASHEFLWVHSHYFCTVHDLIQKQTIIYKISKLIYLWLHLESNQDLRIFSPAYSPPIRYSHVSP